MQSIARELEMNVHVIDMYATCALEKHVAIWIKKLVDEHKSSEEILKIIQPAIDESNSLILVKNLQHLKRGGRLTPMAATLAGLLKIYPVLHINKSTEGRIDVLNKTLGYEKTNNILRNFAILMKEEFKKDFSVISRINGSEFVILIPNIDEKNAKEMVSIFIKKVHDTFVELENKMFVGLFKYENKKSINSIFVEMDYVISQAKLFSEKEYYFIEEIDNCKTKEQWINIINISLKEDCFELVYRNVVDINLKNMIHKTISFELNYKEENLSYKDFRESV